MSEEIAVIEHQEHLPVAAVVDRMKSIHELMRAAMTNELDYGVIPGTNSKPVLLKPGAEKLAMMFRLDCQYDTKKTWHDDGHLTVETYCTVYHIDTSKRLGGASRVCSTREAKYAYRGGSRLCPECNKPCIKKSKFPPRENPGAAPGWYCFAKIGGCGMNYAADDKAIVSQSEERQANPDLADSYNTVTAIAEKRAMVAAIRIVTSASSIFDEQAPDQEPEKPIEKPARRPNPAPETAQTLQEAMADQLDATPVDAIPDESPVGKWAAWLAKSPDLLTLNANFKELKELEKEEQKTVWKMVETYGSRRGWAYNKRSRVFE